MDTPGRLLRLLVLLSSRSSWSAAELVARLEVTDRTLRRDITRLRDLGYPVEGTTGRYGGYALGPGGRLPPLLLDDDEAVAVILGLREVSSTADPGLGESALAALTKLGQVLPSGLRQRVDALGDVSIHTGGNRRSNDSTDVGVLMHLAAACRAGQCQRFDYRRGDGVALRRHVEPYRLVNASRRWYLVAFDLDRDDWRTFRLDRITAPVATGGRVQSRDAPDPASFVTAGLAVGMFASSALVRVHAPPDVTARLIAPTVGVIETHDANATTTDVRIGGDDEWIARYLVSLEVPFEVLDSTSLRAELRRLGQQLIDQHPPVP